MRPVVPETGTGAAPGQATVALVSGANRGIGKEAARQLAQRGYTVLLGSRDAGRGAAAAKDLMAEGLDVRPVPLDVTDPGGVAALAERIGRDPGRLDVLINNAGTFVGATAMDTTVAHMRLTYEVNVFGVVTAIHALLPLLRRSPAPRIVNVSSTTASLELTSNGVSLPGDAERRLSYASAKAALNMLTIQYARAFDRDPDLGHIMINSVTPGYTATDMNDFRGTRTVTEAARVIVDLAILADDGPTGGFFSDEGPVPW